jgi:hypothetical protein
MSRNRVLPSVRVRLAVLISLAAALALPASAAAVPVLDVKLKTPEVRYGASHKLSGTLLDGTTPLANQAIVLEGRRYPYDGSYRVIDRTTTDAEGAFSFSAKLDRNHRLRVSAPAQAQTSNLIQAYTAPEHTLSSRAISPGVAKITQRYTVPKHVKLRSPTLFYLGSRKAKKASLRMTGKLHRTSAGHYTSSVTVTLPAGWNGAFKFASCFRPSPHSGMGDPGAKCPHLAFRF